MVRLLRSTITTVALQPSIYRRADLSKWREPAPKHREVIHQIIKPPYIKGERRRINVCCGWGFGKTTLGIDIAQVLLQLGMSGIFLEPNNNLMKALFLQRWMEMIPPELYKLQQGDIKQITWLPTGAKLHYGHRAVTGRQEFVEWKFQGQTYSFYIDDEASTGCNARVHNALSGRLRDPHAPFLARITLSTPRMGPYADLINEPGSVTIYGKSEDNPYVSPEIFAEMRKSLTRAQARRDMDGELIALEDQIWQMCDLTNSWPQGNVDDMHPRFDPNYPWFLFSDLGTATGADLIVQRIDRGFNYEEPRWVAVADFCPQSDASIRRRYQKLRMLYPTPPAAIVAGRDFNTRAATDGATPAYFARKTWGNVRIIPTDESVYSKQVQLDAAQFLMSHHGERRFTIARDLVDRDPSAALDPDSKRGIVEMVHQDVWLPEDDRRESDFLPKGRKIRVQHIRDAFLMGAHAVMKPPQWAGDPGEKPWDSRG